ncbi:hypothetical protein F5Y10DRAFT_271792 [Nemania abortiva]|nr:hypothetical protein F5Y10DRAFT_271792 [Nemania abortiva]
MSHLSMADCPSCFETKPLSDFPRTRLTRNCEHTATSCLVCVAAYLESRSLNGLIDRLSCPECTELLTFEAIQEVAKPETFERYEKYLVDKLVSKHRNLWCPLLGCGASMVHSTGVQHGITWCRACKRQFCSRHKIAWHYEYTCDEYDRYLADPSFRSKAQKKAAKEAEDASQDDQLQQRINDAENLFSQSLMNEIQAAEARRQAAIEREARERRLAEEIAAREAQRRRQEEEARKLRERQKEEDERSTREILKVTKPCPNCQTAIQKNGGW